jgi:ATP-binding cassette, subfamily B, bacterial
MVKRDWADQTNLSKQIQTFLLRLSYLPKTFRLIWVAAGAWTIVWAAMLVILGLLPAASVYLTRELIDSIVAFQGQGVAWEALRPMLSLLALFAGVMILTLALQSQLNWVRSAQAEYIRDYLTSLVHEKAVSVDLAFYEKADYYDMLHRAREDATSRPLALLENMGSLLQGCITLVAMGAMLIPYGLWLPLLLLVSALPAFSILLLFNRRYHRWWEATTMDRRWSQYYDVVLTHVMSAAEVRLFNLGPHYQNAYQKLRRRLRTESLKLLRDQNLAQLGSGIVGLLAVGGVMGWMVWRVLLGLATLGDLALFYQVFNRGRSLLQSVLGSVGQVYTNILFLRNLFEFLEQRPQVGEPALGLQKPAVLAREIHFRGISFSYPDSQHKALDNFNLTVPAGQLVAIVGANGAGKSSLLKLLCRLYDPQFGAIEFDGIDIRTMPLRELRDKITVLFQDPFPYHATAAQNIQMSNLEADSSQAEMEAAAKAAGAHDVIMRLPDGYNTLLGKAFTGGTELSGGEWQRLALARAFLRPAEIIILDEPTSALDSWSEEDWFARFRRLANGRTAIIITHRFTIAKDADMIHVMDAGQIVESGSHDELLAADGLYARSWRSQTNRQGEQLVSDTSPTSPVHSVVGFETLTPVSVSGTNGQNH